jgi:hypothetical protein
MVLRCDRQEACEKKIEDKAIRQRLEKEATEYNWTDSFIFSGLFAIVRSAQRPLTSFPRQQSIPPVLLVFKTNFKSSSYIIEQTL